MSVSYRDSLLICDRYIRDNPGRRITAQELADLCGYTLPHFSFIFHAFTDMTLTEYVRSLRLREAARAIADGRPILDAALEAGFETPAGFTKAFKKVYGFSPIEYRRRVRSGRPALLIYPDVKEVVFDGRIFGYTIPRTLMTGKVLQSADPGKTSTNKNGAAGAVPDDEETADPVDSAVNRPAAWQDISFDDYPPYPEGMPDRGEIGTFLHPDPVSGDMIYFFGFLTEVGGKSAAADDASAACVDSAAAPDGFTELTLSSGLYAIFNVSYTVEADTVPETARKIAAAWQAIFADWLASDDCGSLTYDESRLPFEFYRRSRAYIYVPVK